jgi:hypothetical protein|tara:strand:- start:532 stop:1656 length:1125 start_codon:yes stop_codon:yes gene_type:complete
MKLLLEQWREYLNEAELRYSESAFEKISETVNAAVESDKDSLRKIKIPAQEVFYLDNKKIKNGAVILWLAHFGGQPLDAMNFVHKEWNSETGMRDRILKQFIIKPLEILLNIDKNYTSLGGVGTGTLKGQRIITLSINPWKHSSPDQIKSTIRHELQHVTQVLNGFALEYGESLFDANGDASKLKKISFSPFEKEFGTGSQKTGLRQLSPQQAKERGISDKERTKRYLGDDFEYETWMSDLLDDFVRWLKNNEFINKSNFEMADFKEKNPNILLEQTSNIKSRKNVINLAKQFGMKPIDFVKMWKKTPSFNQLAVKFSKAILTNDQILSKFAEDSNMNSYVKAVKTLLKLRSKEFAGDFTKNLELRLRKEVENA